MKSLVLPTLVLLASCSSASGPAENGPRSAQPKAQAEVPYGTQDREDLLGAVTAVSTEETQHVHDVLEMLRGHVPGLQVTELPNGDITLRLRGQQQGLRVDEEANQPLLVIDGMPIPPGSNGRILRALGPRQIESIHVLRDLASTAIFGRRGANGVILIRTKTRVPRF